MSDIAVKVLEDKNDNWELLLETWYDFNDRETTTATVSGLTTPESRSKLRLCLRDIIQGSDYPVIVAVDTTKQPQMVVGFILHQEDSRIKSESDKQKPYHDQPGSFKYCQYQWHGRTVDEWEHYDKFWTNLEKRVDFFGRYPDVDKFWTVMGLGVHQSYGRRGIATRMVNFSLELAKQRGHTIVRANFASLYSRKVGYTCGFTTILELHFSEYGNYNNMPQSVRELHDKCEVMVKYI